MHLLITTLLAAAVVSLISPLPLVAEESSDQSGCEPIQQSQGNESGTQSNRDAAMQRGSVSSLKHSPKPATPWSDRSTERMAQRLKELAASSDPSANIFMNDERVQGFAELAKRATSPAERLNWLSRLANELLNAGRAAQAVRVFEYVIEQCNEIGSLRGSKAFTALKFREAVAYLRLGEEDNCLANHSAESCLFPIEGAGIHNVQRGSRGAIERLEDLLEEAPEDLSARWLLNIAYMTLGEYPAKVPPQWRLDPGLFESEHEMQRFHDIAPALGLDVDDLAGGSIVEDFDGDGYLDIMASSMALDGQLRLFRNQSDGTFEERTAEAGLIGLVGGLNIVQTDYNNDGHPDVLVLRGGWMFDQGKFPNSLLRNNGNGTFSDVTEQSGLLSFHPTQTAVWFDYNGDSQLDLFIGNESSEDQTHPCELFRNNGDGTFTECAAALGLNVIGFVKGVASGDFNNDRRPDLYISRRGESNLLYRNDGPISSEDSTSAAWKFTEVSAVAGVRQPLFSFPTWFFDYDNDGWEDLFVADYDLKTLGDLAADHLGLPHSSEHARLFRNNRDGTFSDVTRSVGLDHVFHTMGCNYGDLDGDGYLDFYLGTGDPNLATLIPNRMLRNAGGKSFQDVTTSGGFGHLQKGHGVSFADLDHDGDQDIYIVLGGAYTGDRYRNVLFENPSHAHRWISLKLEGVESNRAAIGAKIKVVVETPSGERTIYKTVSSGGSFGASPLRQEIGLGNARSIRSVEIVWPGPGKTQVLKNLAMDRIYRVKQGEPEAIEWRLKKFKLASR